MEPITRFFLCAECRCSVHLCSRCDHGQRYCHADCAQRSRRRHQRQAQQRYQRSRRGRFCHAARMRRYRARQKKVTHQRSNQGAGDALLVADSAVVSAAPTVAVFDLSVIRCAGCGCRCASRVRRNFLKNRRIHHRFTFDRIRQ